MKGVFYRSIGSAASVIGAVIGAGFITGAEIVRFFSGTFLLPACAALFVTLTVFFTVISYLGMRYGGLTGLNLRVFGRFSKIINASVLICSFITLAGMCAGADALFSSASGIDERIPALSAVFLAISLFVCEKGIDGVSRFNLLLVPVMITAIVAACAGSVSVKTVFTGESKIFSVVVYASMNCFLSAAVIADTGKGNSPFSVVIASVLAAFAISVCAYIVMNKISSSASLKKNIPLLSSVESGFFKAVFFTVTLAGIITTLVSSHYPLVALVKKSPVKRTLNAVFAVSALALSRLGFYKIVNKLYPVIGVVGLFYVLSLSLFALKESFFPDGKFFRKGYERVHSRCEKTKHQRGGVN